MLKLAQHRQEQGLRREGIEEASAIEASHSVQAHTSSEKVVLSLAS